MKRIIIIGALIILAIAVNSASNKNINVDVPQRYIDTLSEMNISKITYSYQIIDDDTLLVKVKGNGLRTSRLFDRNKPQDNTCALINPTNCMIPKTNLELKLEFQKWLKRKFTRYVAVYEQNKVEQEIIQDGNINLVKE